MLKFRWRRVTPELDRETARLEREHPLRSVAATNPDLEIRNLLDDPRLRACLERDPSDVTEPPVPVVGTSTSTDVRDDATSVAA